MHLAELKAKSPADLLACAEDLNIENASSLRKQDMMFAILKALADNDQAIYGDGTLEILHDGFGYLRSPNQTTFPARMTFTSPPPRCAASACGQGIRLKARSAPHVMASAISLF